MRVKLAWLVRVGVARPPPFTTITITSKIAVYAPAEWADILTLFHLYQYMYSVVTPVELTYGRGGGGGTSQITRAWFSLNHSILSLY